MPYPKHVCELKTETDADEMKQAGWQEKCKNYIRSWSLISTRNFRSYLFLRTRGAILKERMKQKNSKYWYIVHPFSLLRLYWEIFLLCTYLVFAFFLSFRNGFLNSFVATYYRTSGKSLRNIYISAWIELSLSVICLIDTMGYFITGYYDPEAGETVMTPQEIQKAYFFSDFFLDLSSSFPSDASLLLFGGIDFYTSGSQARFICLELYNMFRLVRFRRAIPYLWQCSKLSLFSLLFFRLAFTFVIYLLLIHWVAELSVVVPEMTTFKGLLTNCTNETVYSWIQITNFLNMEIEEQYLTTLIKALQNNIGANEAAEELFSGVDYLIALLSSLLGRFYFLFFLLMILEVVTASSALDVRFRLILDQLNTFMKRKDMPASLKKRMSRFYLYRLEAHYFSQKAMLGRLAESLRTEICTYTYQRLLHNTEVFQSVPKKVLISFIQTMNREMYFPKDVIIQGNTFGECMYFISSGSVLIEADSEKEICRLGDGEFFGEIALIVPDRRRIATVRALTITEVYRLEYSDFMIITDLYPDVYNVLEKYALERYKTTILVEKLSKM